MPRFPFRAMALNFHQGIGLLLWHHSWHIWSYTMEKIHVFSSTCQFYTNSCSPLDQGSETICTFSPQCWLYAVQLEPVQYGMVWCNTWVWVGSSLQGNPKLSWRQQNSSLILLSQEMVPHVFLQVDLHVNIKSNTTVLLSRVVLLFF